MTTRVGAFDETVEKTYVWLDALNELMGWPDRQQAYMALRAVLHALRDRLTPAEAVDLAAQLPMLMRGFYFEGWNPADKPLRYRDKNPFLEQVAREAPWLKGDTLEHAVTAVFQLLGSELAYGEPEQARQLLPPELRELWPRAGL